MFKITKSPLETEAVGGALARALEADGVRRAFIAMRGEMGVGKTAFTRGFASHFGVAGVKSPTYTIVNEYRGRVRIFHFDMYRITDSDDLYSIGYDDYVESDGYCIAEWSENIESDIPSDAIFVTISRTDDAEGRRIEINYEDIGI
jgi:tRNA threonylcarbamoyladenosine biosynthesis protein TsaE